MVYVEQDFIVSKIGGGGGEPSQESFQLYQAQISRKCCTLGQLAQTEFKEETLLVKVERKLARNTWPGAP